jgi:divalent metal cation (Fe/Co/Zn/Cd) transporter
MDKSQRKTVFILASGLLTYLVVQQFDYNLADALISAIIALVVLYTVGDILWNSVRSTVIWLSRKFKVSK